MTEEIYNKLSLYKNSIFHHISSLDNLDAEEIKKIFDKSINNIKNILNNIQDDKSKDMFIRIITEIKSELRRKIIKECQEKAAVMNQYGVQYIEAENYESILIMNYLIELCVDLIKEVQEPENKEEIVEPKKNILYIYSSKMPKSKEDFKTIKLIREDLESIPPVYYGTFSKIIEDMHSGIYAGKEHKCKRLNSSKLDNSFEHRERHGERLYENNINTYNNKIAKKIKQLEKELGAEIHFVYKLEIKKCDRANGLDEEREKRYKNENKNFEELIMTLTKEEVKSLAEATYSAMKEFLTTNKKNQSKKEEEEEIALYTVLDIISFYTHHDYSLSDCSELEVTDERAAENEKYQIFKRIVMYLDTKDLEELKELSKIFNLVDERISENDNDYSSSKEKQKIAEREKNKIISLILYLLGEMELEELKEKELEIILLLDYKDEYEISNSEKDEERIYGRK